VRKSIRDTDDAGGSNIGKRWIERCGGCERFKMVDCKFFVEGSNFPSIRVAWFDSEGMLNRITGDGAHMDTTNGAL
jgi:hypothetical protein